MILYIFNTFLDSSKFDVVREKTEIIIKKPKLLDIPSQEIVIDSSSSKMVIGFEKNICIKSVISKFNTDTTNHNQFSFINNSDNPLYVDIDINVLEKIQDSTHVLKDFSKINWNLKENGNNFVHFEKILSNYIVNLKITEVAKYMFKIEVNFQNNSDKTILLRLNNKICRDFSKPFPESDKNTSIMNAHEGFIGVFDGGFLEINYNHMVNYEKGYDFHHQGKKAWAGLTDKYYLIAFSNNDGLIAYVDQTNNNYLTFLSLDFTEIAPKNTTSIVSYMFCGPKSINILNQYKQQYDLEKFDLAIDFGMLYFITRPVLYALKWLYDFVGNFGLAIILLTLLLKLLFIPFSRKSYISMSKMRKLKPRIDSLKDSYKDDKQKFNIAVADLYKKEKINPLSGILTMVMQIPVFFAMYKVLFICIEMKNAPFYLWIKDLSSPDPTSILNLFGLIPFELPNFLQIGIWPVIMGGTMVLQQKITGANMSDDQKKFMIILPIVFIFMFAQFPAGLVIYWSFSNIFSILQQIWFNKKYS